MGKWVGSGFLYGNTQKIIRCCKDCKPPKRRPACHDSCPDYLAEKNKMQEIKNAENVDKQIKDYHSEMIDKRLKRLENSMKNR